MVLDSRQMDWAGRQGLDSAALKRAKVPIYGKWYFPDLPANEPLVNLSTGEIETFPPGYRAGAVLYVKDADLKRAGLGPYKAAAPAPAPAAAPAAAQATAVAEPVAAAPVAARPAPADRPTPAARAAPVAEAPVRTVPPQGPAPAAPAGGHESAPHQAARQQAAHELGHAAPLHGAPAEHAHPGAGEYIVVAVILAIVTAVEVAVYYLPEVRTWLPLILILLSAFKFFMVVAFFMHLKFDHPSFRWYFGGGLALALVLASSVAAMQIGTHGLPHGY